MLKTAAVITAVLLLLTSQACVAVDLEAGWYVNFQYVHLFGPYGPDQGLVQWYCTSDLGQFGSILVENVGPPNIGRQITILESFSAAPGTVLFEDYGTYEDRYPYYPVVDFGWITDYDASRMQLQVFRHGEGQLDELVWSQTTSGYVVDYGNIWNTTPLQSGEDVVFRVVVVPEPCGVAFLALGIGICSSARVRRRQR